MNGEDRLRKIFDFDSPKKDEKGVAWSAFGGVKKIVYSDLI